MYWEAIDAVSNLLAAIVVVITLAYLAIQIRQNTLTLRSTATQAAHDQAAALYDLVASDPELGAIFARGMEAPETLNENESTRFFALLMSTTFRLQNWYLQTESATIEGDLLASWVKVMRQFSALPGWQKFWKQRRHIFTPALVAYLEEKVFSNERDPSYRPMGVVRPHD